MRWMRTRNRSADRLAFIDAYRFPSSVRQRFAFRYGALAAEDVATVEAATRQWFRMAVRLPRTRLSMPSVVADDLWHEFVLHTEDYAAFCDAALGRFLHHRPELGTTPEATDGLVASLRLAQMDEGCRPDQLPLLFRVDHELGIEGGRRYLADCGGRGQCHELPGAVCLQHVSGLGRGPGGRNRAPDRWHGAGPPGGADACSGGGCGT